LLDDLLPDFLGKLAGLEALDLKGGASGMNWTVGNGEEGKTWRLGEEETWGGGPACKPSLRRSWRDFLIYWRKKASFSADN
jgi:hypothetical protein